MERKGEKGKGKGEGNIMKSDEEWGEIEKKGRGWVGGSGEYKVVEMKEQNQKKSYKNCVSYDAEIGKWKERNDSSKIGLMGCGYDCYVLLFILWLLICANFNEAVW